MSDIDLTFTLRLQDDYNGCCGALFAENEQERQFWRRAAYRSFFEATEAWMAINRRHLVPSWHEQQKADLQEEARKAVADLLQVNIYKRSFVERLETNVRLCVLLSGYTVEQVECMMLHDVFGVIITVARVRNRIAHPKNNDDYEVSDEETHALAIVGKWFLEFFAGVKYPEWPTVLVDERFMQ